MRQHFFMLNGYFMKSLVLAEKPSVAKELARVLNCHKHNKGYLEGSEYIVTWALGHLVTLAEPEEYDHKYKEWNLDYLPMLPEKMRLSVLRETGHQFHTVCNLMKRGDVDEFIIATDAGREGELVARWIMKLGGWRGNFKRLWISSQTDQAIKDGFRTLKSGHAYDNLYQAAVCRAEADWLIGLNVTRALTCKFNAQLSAGRVQTPTLAMIIRREQEIKQFQPVDYWMIEANFGDYTGYWRDHNGNGRIYQQDKAQQILQKVQNQQAIIQEVRRDIKTEVAPLCYDLTELQRDANIRYGFSAQKTLSLAQSLYEHHKVLSYPRTDSRYLSSDLIPTFSQRLQAINVGPYQKWVQNLLGQRLNPGKRFIADDKVSDHHALIPTEQKANLENMDADERKLYDLVVRRFLCILSPVYRYEQLTIITQVQGENFYARGRVILDLGWRDIAMSAATREAIENQDDLPEQTLQQEVKGNVKKIVNVRLENAKTKPPSRYTEASLLGAMESPQQFIEDEELRETIKESGLGTPATRAEIIEKLLYNFYIERQGKNLIPTSKGTQLIELVPAELKSPELTAEWELRLNKIARGKEDSAKFMAEIRRHATELVNRVKEDTSVFKVQLTKQKCPICGQFMQVFNSRKGKTLICSDRSCGFQQSEHQDRSGRTSYREKIMTKKLIEKYTESIPATTNVGDILKEALAKKEKKN